MSSVLDTLASLVSINSINPEWRGPGESEVAAFVRSYFETCGIEVWEEEVLPGRNNVMARLPGKDSGRAVILEAHMDTVSVDDMTIPPFQPDIKDGLLYGRGSCDTKAGLAGMMEALRSLKEEGQTPPCDVILAAVVDEEHAYRGVVTLVDSLQKRKIHAIACVVAEPTELRLVRANKGVLRWKIQTHGVSAHSSKPHLGKNAIVAMAKVIGELETFHQKIGERSHPLVGVSTCNIGIIEGGAQVNFVPEKCTITLDQRLLPGETALGVYAEYEALLRKMKNDHPELEVTMSEPLLTDEAMETPENSEVVSAAAKVLSQLDLNPEPCGVPFGCDCTKLSRAGIPSIIFGPGSIDQAHGAVEYVDVNEAQLGFDFYRRFLLECGT